MDRRVLGVLAALGLAVAAAAGAALAQNDNTPSSPPPDSSAAPSGPADDTTPPSTPDTSPPDTTPEPPVPDVSQPKPPKPTPAPRPTSGATTQTQTPAPTGQTSLDQLLPPDATQTPAAPSGPPPVPANAVLLMMGLDKITGKPTQISAPLNLPVKFATFTITARYCYSTPPSETPETSAFVQIDDHRPDQPEHRIFSGWMYASSPGLNGVEHPLYDVWVISCKTSAPGHAVTAHVASPAPVRVGSPDAGDNEGVTQLPEGSGQ